MAPEPRPVQNALLDAARKAGAPDVPADPSLVIDEDDQGTNQNPDGKAPSDGAARPEPEGGTKTEEERIAALPENFFGENLQDYAKDNGVEATEGRYKGLQDANRVANSRLREIADIRKAAEDELSKAKAALAAKPPEVSDEDDISKLEDDEVLARMGIDASSIPYDELKKPMVVMARQTLQSQAQMEALAAGSENDRWEREFFGRLEKLQDEFGEITLDDGTQVDKATLETYAIENSIFHPDALYWALQGPVVAQSKKLAPSQAKVDQKRQIGTRPRRAAPAGGTQPKKPVSLADHFDVVKRQKGVTEDPFAHPE